MDLAAELNRRHANIRAAMGEHGLDALIVSGNEYSGFEGAVTYVSGFQIVHRYAYVVIPADGDPFIVFPTEARYVGEHGTTPLEQVFHARPGEHIAAHAKGAGWKRIGVYGLDYIMAVRDYAALDGLDLVGFDVEFDLARAVKSDAELESVRDSVRINQRGFELWHEAYAPGKTAAEVMAAAEEWFIAEGCGRLTMNMVLTGTDSFARPEFKIARSTMCCRGSCSPRSRWPARACTGSRSPAPSAHATLCRPTRRSGCSRATWSTTRPPREPCTPARPATTCTSRCRRASPTAATTWGT